MPYSHFINATKKILYLKRIVSKRIIWYLEKKHSIAFWDALEMSFSFKPRNRFNHDGFIHIYMCVRRIGLRVAWHMEFVDKSISINCPEYTPHSYACHRSFHSHGEYGAHTQHTNTAHKHTSTRYQYDCLLLFYVIWDLL